MKVLVLKGGVSRERDVSLKSGAAVAAALARVGHDVVEHDIRGFDFVEVTQTQKPDVVFLALHGQGGEDGTIQGVLEWMKVSFTGPGLAGSAISYSKFMTKVFAASFGVRTPEWRVLRTGENVDAWIAACDLPLPVMVKPDSEGSSIGVSRVFKKEEFKPALELALKSGTTILVEQMIQGREVTVGVLLGKALPVVEVRPKSGFYDFASKYTPGATDYLVPAELPEATVKELNQNSETLYQHLKLRGAVRIDYMLDGSLVPYFIEVNTIPGMTETSLLPKAAAAAGVGFELLCDQLVKSALD